MPVGTEPLVSVVIAVYNGERYVGESIASVLAQTWSRLECIVVDDGSTDATPAVVAAFAAIDDRVRYVARPNGGVSVARNDGIDHARGELVAFLDADDVWLPDKLALQVACFRRRPDLGLVFSGYVVTDMALRERMSVLPDRRNLDLVAWLMLEGSGIGLSFTGVVPRAVIAEVGGFDPSLSTSADLEFACRVAAARPVDAVDGPLALYRNHDGQMHLDLVAFEADMRRIFDRRFADDPGRRHRALANLHTRLFFAHVAGHRWGRARVELGGVLGNRPASLVQLPTVAAVRRARRRLDRWWRGITHREVRPPALHVPPRAS